MVAAAGAGVAAIQHELFRSEARLARLFAENGSGRGERGPRLARVQVHFDYSRIGRDGEFGQTRVLRRSLALDDDGQAEFGDGGLYAGEEGGGILRGGDRRRE